MPLFCNSSNEVLRDIFWFNWSTAWARLSASAWGWVLGAPFFATPFCCNCSRELLFSSPRLTASAFLAFCKALAWAWKDDLTIPCISNVSKELRRRSFLLTASSVCFLLSETAADWRLGAYLLDKQKGGKRACILSKWIGNVLASFGRDRFAWTYHLIFQSQSFQILIDLVCILCRLLLFHFNDGGFDWHCAVCVCHDVWWRDWCCDSMEGKEGGVVSVIESEMFFPNYAHNFCEWVNASAHWQLAMIMIILIMFFLSMFMSLALWFWICSNTTSTFTFIAAETRTFHPEWCALDCTR